MNSWRCFDITRLLSPVIKMPSPNSRKIFLVSLDKVPRKSLSVRYLVVRYVSLIFFMTAFHE